MHILRVDFNGQVTATQPHTIHCAARFADCDCELCQVRRDALRALAILEPYANSGRIVSAEIDLYREYKEIRARI